MIHYSSFKTPMAKAVRYPFECEWKRQTRRFGKNWQVGDIVGFKETWSTLQMYDALTPSQILQEIGEDRMLSIMRYGGKGQRTSGRTRSYQFMPHAVVDLYGRITEVRENQPIQDISEYDAMMEGTWIWANNPEIDSSINSLRRELKDGGFTDSAFDKRINEACRRTRQTDPKSGVLTARGCMATLWDSIYGNNPEKCWKANPAPTAYTFELITREEALKAACPV